MLNARLEAFFRERRTGTAPAAFGAQILK